MARLPFLCAPNGKGCTSLRISLPCRGSLQGMANPLCTTDPSHRGQQRYTKGIRRSDLTLKSCHWEGSSGQRRISTLPLNHADKCWAQASRSRQVALWCKVQKCWKPLNGTKIDETCQSHTFIHPHWKTLSKLCHMIQRLKIRYHPLLHIFSTDTWGKKRCEACKNVYNRSLLNRKSWYVREPLLHFG